LKLQSLKVPAPSRSSAPSKPGVIPAKLAPHASSRQPAAARDDRRHSQRVLLRVRANVHVALQGKPVTFDVFTLSVNTAGAIVVMTQSLPPETRLVLEHGTTKEKVACKVARPGKEMPEGFHVALEFDSPAPDFWKIAFPPSDWRPVEES